MFENSEVVIYTDGSSLIKGDYYESSGAIIITVDGSEVYRYGEFFPNGTNSKGEVNAMKFAFDKLYELFDVSALNSITIICDSEYVVNSINKWIYGWAKNNWLNSNNEEVKFCDIFQYLYFTYLDKKVKNKKIKVYHIHSHRKDTIKERRKFMAINNIDVTQSEYDRFTYWNNQVDEFAGLIRAEKKTIEKRVFGSEISKLNIEKRDGRFVIKSRKVL